MPPSPEYNEELDLADVELGDPKVPSSDGRAQKPGGHKKGCHIRWSRICKKVEVNQQNSGLLRGSIATPTIETDKAVQSQGPSTKTILDSVSGSASPGEVLALMGPSGSGKTSLLDVLSGRSKYDSGKITMDGLEVTGTVMKRLKRKIAYVKQADIFFDHLSVQDQLTYTALLRLPSTIPTAQKHLEVKRIIQQLRLTKCAQTPIYMVSGGEKKRVNIGTELLTDPLAIILDEPTSGLDSTSAVALLKLLHTLSREAGKTILTSIHQPSSAVFRGFDKLMFLAEGHTVYFGSPVDSLTYLRNRNFACPSGYNAADHWMDLLVVDSALEDDEEAEGEEETETDDFVPDEEGENRRFSRYSVKAAQGVGGLSKRQRRAKAAMNDTPRMKLIAAWDDEVVARRIDDENLRIDAETAETSTSNEEVALYKEKKYNTSWLTQFQVLMHRSMKNSRSAIFTTLNLVKSVLIGLITGLLWFQLPYTEATVFDRSSYYFFTMTYWVFDAMFTALMAFPSERQILLKERASGSYQLSAYFMAKTLSEAPTRLILPALYMIVSYWMAGVSPSFVVFIGSTFCTLLSVMTGESIGLFIGATVFDFEKSLVVMTVLSLMLMIAGGFFVQNVPGFIAWVKFLSPFKYAYDGSAQIVFREPVPCDGSSVLEVCGGGSEGTASVEEVHDFLRVQGGIAFNVGMLFVLFLIPRFFAYVALRSKKAGERT